VSQRFVTLLLLRFQCLLKVMAPIPESQQDRLASHDWDSDLSSSPSREREELLDCWRPTSCSQMAQSWLEGPALAETSSASVESHRADGPYDPARRVR